MLVDRAVKYDPKQSFEVRPYDDEYQFAYGRSWEARTYQPQGEGTFTNGPGAAAAA